MTYHRQERTGPAIVTRGLTRHFTSRKQTVEAVRGLDLEIGQGELVAFLGPNGAGKSTTLRMLTTLIAPTSGSASVAGHDVVSGQRDVRHAIGFVGQGNGAGHRQLGRDELVSQGRAHGLSRAAARRRAAELVEDLDLAAVADRKVSSLSGGQRRRLDIAMGMVHRPRLLFLDEPSTGLDPQNRTNLKEHIQALRRDHGTTVVLTTHYLDEADALADRVIVVDHGRVIADDTPARLKSELVGDHLAVTALDETDAPAVAATIERLGAPQSIAVDGAVVTARVAGATSLVPELLRALDAAGTCVAAAEVSRATLDDVFLHLTGRSLRESALSMDAPAGPIDRTPADQMSTDLTAPILEEQAS
jgi:ABC-2 type transport system ATP-binding protein